MTDVDGPVAVPAGIPPAEVDIDEGLVRALLRAQHPDLAELPIRHVATGWDNSTYRLGDRWAVRLPRITDAVTLLRNEQRWLPELAGELPIPVPAPVRVGQPGEGFPWPWSVVPWVPGRTAEHAPLSPSEAGLFGRFLAAVHRPAPADFPRNGWRGIPLAQVDDDVRARLERLSERDVGPTVSLVAVAERWRRALAAPDDVVWTRVHADLHPRNLVVDGGHLVTVLDWGDMTIGDPAIDLGAVRMLFDGPAWPDVWRAYGPVSPATMVRATGWAVFFGSMLLTVGLAGDSSLAEIGRRTLARACAD